MVVALLLFFVGGAFSVYEGVHRIAHGEAVSSPIVALAVLGVSVVLEAFSLAGALRAWWANVHGIGRDYALLAVLEMQQNRRGPMMAWPCHWLTCPRCARCWPKTSA